MKKITLLFLAIGLITMAGKSGQIDHHFPV